MESYSYKKLYMTMMELKKEIKTSKIISQITRINTYFLKYKFEGYDVKSIDI